MQEIPFVKMHGLGNDFVVIDERSTSLGVNWKEQVGTLLHRRFGIGGDSLLVLQPSSEADCKMRIYENDGLESENCGNGLRCVAKYLREAPSHPGRAPGAHLRIETLSGVMNVEEVSIEKYKVQMGPAHFEAHEICVTQDPAPWGSELSVAGRLFRIYTVSMGNPHVVIFVDSHEDLAFVTQYGPLIERHPWFPRRTNVNFVFRQGPSHMVVRTWERSAGHTLACGTGACAVGVVAIRTGISRAPCLVQFEYGDLEISWQEGQDVWMTGPAKTVFEGMYYV